MAFKYTRLLSLPDEITKEMTCYEIAVMVGYRNPETVRKILRSIGRKYKRKPGRKTLIERMGGAMILDILDKRDQNMTYSAIADSLSVSRHTVKNVILKFYPRYKKNARFPRRAQGRARKARNQISVDMEKIVITKRDQGHTFQGIACELNISRQRVHQIYKKTKTTSNFP